MIRTRRLAGALGLMAATLLIATPAQAQQGRGGYGMGGGMAGPNILANPAVQKELKLTDDQVEKARAFAEEYQSKGREMMSQTEGLEGRERMEKMQELGRKHAAAGMKEAETMLKPEQAARLKQIVFQQQGLNAFSDPEIAKELKITPEQKDKVSNLMETTRSETREAMQDAGNDRQAGMAKMQKIRKDSMTKALALMTPEQVAKVKAMAGEPFEMPMMGGGGRGNRGNN